MSWRPRTDPPRHPANDFNLRVAELYDVTGALVGHVLVEQEIIWPQIGGALWWKRWGEPEYALALHMVVGGRFHEVFLRRREDVDEVVVSLERSEWVEKSDVEGHRAVYRLTWVAPAEAAAVAQDALGIDLEELRRSHRHGDR